MLGSDVGVLLFADVAVDLGYISGKQAAAALQRYWEGEADSLESLIEERFDDESREHVSREVERRISQAGGDARSALLRHGIARSVHAHLTAEESEELRQRAGHVRTPLRKMDDDRYTGFTPLGQGSMGSVYLAADTEMNRLVAFKMIRTGAGSPLDEMPRSPNDEMVTRFLQEAWVTGGLEHPGIVPVYEVGQTPSGVPYYTMRVVRGERTLESAIAEAGSPSERLQLLDPFLRVCDAIRYAHSRGVVHRDLKPANVALGQFGETMVLDWGLAKLDVRREALESRWQARMAELRDETDLQTLTGALGTPGYMAPEAALGQVQDIDERSDVYSLGAILYRILEGRLPHRFESMSELIEKLAHATPKPPDGPAGLAAICMKALSRKRDDRYTDAGELAEEIRDWQVQSALDREVQGLVREARVALDGAAGLAGAALLRQVEHVTATTARALELSPDNENARALRARARGLRDGAIRERERHTRNRILKRVAVFGLTVATAAAAFVAVLLDDRRRDAEDAREKETEARLLAEDSREKETDARKLAEDAREKEADARRQADTARESETEARRAAEQARGRAEGLANFMLFDLRDSLTPIGKLDLLGRVARKSLEYYESLPTEELSSEQSHARAIALQNVGDVLHAMGDMPNALASYEESLAVQRRVVASNPDNSLWKRDLKFCLDRIGDVHIDSRRFDKAMTSYQESLEIGRDMTKRNPGNDEWQCYLAWSLDRVADVERERGDVKSAHASYSESLVLREKIAAGNPSNALWQADLCSTLDRLGSMELRLRDPKSALARADKSLRIRRGLVEAQPRSARFQFELTLSLSRQGDARRTLGDVDGAFESYDESRLIADRLVRFDPKNAAWRRQLGQDSYRSIQMLVAKRDLKRALPACLAWLAKMREYRSRYPDEIAWQQIIDMALLSVGDVYLRTEEWAKAIEAFRESVAIAKQAADLPPESGATRRALAWALDRLAFAQEGADDLDAAAHTRAAAFEAHKRAVELAPTFKSEHARWEQNLRRVLLLTGKRTPHDFDDQLLLGSARYERKEYVRSAKRYKRGLEEEAARKDLARFNLYNATCSAILASVELKGEEAAKWRDQGLEWLAEDLRLRREACASAREELQGEPTPERAAELQQTLATMKRHFEHVRVSDPDLATVRESKEFKRLVGALE